MLYRERLERLMSQESSDLDLWPIGRIPKHYKRISVDRKEALELAKLGFIKINAAYGEKLYYDQALIAGAILSGEFDNIVIVTPSQFGKSWLMGHIVPLLAAQGEDWYTAGATGDKTGIIMNYVVRSLQDAAPEIQMLLEGVDKSKLDKLATTLSKQHITFARSLSGEKGGSIEAVSLGETYQGLAGNKAIGKGGNYIVDEAALVGEDSMIELGRREFRHIDGHKDKLVMISNPHNPGYFYDALTEENPDERTFILWMDALTAVEEGRFTKKQVLESENAKHKSTCIRYLLCELDLQNESMFDEPLVDDSHEEGVYFLGIDAAYKGKDYICFCLGRVGSKVHVEKLIKLDSSNWIDGVTGPDIIKFASQLCGKYNVQYVCVDIGFGVWLIEGLAALGLPIKGVNFGEGPTKYRVQDNNYAAINATNKRAEMHLDLQDLMETRSITFSSEAVDMLREEMSAVSAERKTNGKIQIVPKAQVKAQIGKSPDELDSVLLMIHAFILYSGNSFAYITE